MLERPSKLMSSGVNFAISQEQPNRFQLNFISISSVGDGKIDQLKRLTLARLRNGKYIIAI